MIRRFRPRPFTWNGGWPQKRPFLRSEFQVGAKCFHLERPKGTGDPLAATTVPGGGAEKGNGTGKPPKRMSVPGGKTRRTRIDSSSPRPSTGNGGWPQKRPFLRSEFQVGAKCFHLERPKGTGDPLAATTVPGGGAEKGNGTGKPPKRMSVPDGKTRRTRMDSSLPRPSTGNGGWPQKRPFPMSEFQVEAICFHPERPIGTDGPPAATTVPGGRTEGNNRTGSPPKGTTVPSGKPEDRSRNDGPPKATIVPGGKPESGKAQQKNRRTLQPGGPKTYCTNPYIA